jgi:multicomponent Na+:H+ antiporter subunit B
VTEYVDIALLALLAVTGVALMRIRDLLAVVILGGIYSLLSALLWLVMDSPDVAFTEAAVGVGISTVLMLGALSLVGREEAPARHSRLIPLLVVLVTGATLTWGMLDVPPFGAADNPVQGHINIRYVEESGEETGVPNTVTSVLASYRGYDTMGESTVIFTAGVGVLLLLAGTARRRRGSAEEDAEAGDEDADAGDEVEGAGAT